MVRTIMAAAAALLAVTGMASAESFWFGAEDGTILGNDDKTPKLTVVSDANA